MLFMTKKAFERRVKAETERLELRVAMLEDKLRWCEAGNNALTGKYIELTKIVIEMSDFNKEYIDRIMNHSSIIQEKPEFDVNEEDIII